MCVPSARVDGDRGKNPQSVASGRFVHFVAHFVVYTSSHGFVGEPTSSVMVASWRAYHARRGWPSLSDSPRRHGDTERTRTRRLANAASPLRGLSPFARRLFREAEEGARGLLFLQLQTRENGGLVRPRRTGPRYRASVSFFSVPLCLRGSVPASLSVWPTPNTQLPTPKCGNGSRTARRVVAVPQVAPARPRAEGGLGRPALAPRRGRATETCDGLSRRTENRGRRR